MAFFFRKRAKAKSPRLETQDAARASHELKAQVALVEAELSGSPASSARSNATVTSDLEAALRKLFEQRQKGWQVKGLALAMNLAMRKCERERAPCQPLAPVGDLDSLLDAFQQHSLRLTALVEAFCVDLVRLSEASPRVESVEEFLLLAHDMRNSISRYFGGLLRWQDALRVTPAPVDLQPIVEANIATADPLLKDLRDTVKRVTREIAAHQVAAQAAEKLGQSYTADIQFAPRIPPIDAAPVFALAQATKREAEALPQATPLLRLRRGSGTRDV